jgi:hypothetical protein
LGFTLLCAGGVFTLAAMVLFPMGVLLFAIEDELAVAFSIFRVIDEVKKHSRSYFRVFLIVFIMGLIIGIASLIPLFGWIIGILAGFYISVETSLFMSEVGWEITGREVPDMPETPTEPAHEENSPS